MTRNFCTLFDSNFLLQGLAMYRSLEKNSDNFHLYIYACDQEALNILNKMALSRATIIALEEAEDDALRLVKAQRTRREYYWTITPQIILYTLKHYGLLECTYIDADMLFFTSPEELFKEFGDNSILIVSHRYGPNNDKAYKLGKYCVQFNTFRSDERGLQALSWWRERCIEWCYEKLENGKFGDQKYLDDWPEKFAGVHELQNLGGGVAPWNIEQYEFFVKSGQIFGKEKNNGSVFPLIFYHFHHTQIFNIFGHIKTKSYHNVNLHQTGKIIYGAFEAALEEALREIKTVSPAYSLKYAPAIDYVRENIREALPRPIKKSLKRILRP